MESWMAHVNCVGAVLGARQTGKTSLLLKLRHLFKDKYSFVFVDLQAIEGAHECFSYISEQIIEQLTATLGDVDLPQPKDSKTFVTFLRDLSRKARAVRIIVILDEIGSLQPETAMKLAGTIRAVFTDRLVKPEFARYMFVLAGATDMLELTTGRNSPLGNVTEKIYLGDLSLLETEQLLAEVLGASMSWPFPEITGHLHTWTSGHPYWTQLLASTLANHPQPPTEQTIGAIVGRLLRTEDKNLPHLVRCLNEDNALWNLVESLLNGMSLSFSRANATIARLELIGVLKDEDGHCRIRNKIYQEAMHKHQIKPVRLAQTHLRVLDEIIQAASDPASLLRDVTAFLHDVVQNHSVIAFTKAPRRQTYHASFAIGVPAELYEGLEFNDLPEIEQVRLPKTACSLLLPIKLQGVVICFLSLGEKLSGEKYDSHDLQFLEIVAERVAQGIERMSFYAWQRDANGVLEIQRNLLPKEIPQAPGVQIAGVWLPARIVGGDYYDVLKFGPDKVAVCIGDVVGKGLPAAMLMSNLQAQVKVYASEVTMPGVLCEQVNRLTANHIGVGKFITFFYALLDSVSRQLSYTNAGHSAPILVRRNGEVRRLTEGGPLLGVFPDATYTEARITLAPGDRLVLFTDGVTEVQDANGTEFEEERLIQLLTAHRELDAQLLQEKIIEAITTFSDGEFHDDVTLLLLALPA
jgi:serine phosphatase RsbU (regulator of sigma subunit)